MRRPIVKAILLPCLLLLIIPAIGQKKNFTFEQVFKNIDVQVTKPLPVIKGWTDDTHYLALQKDANGKTSTMVVDVKTGNAVPYQNIEAKEPPMPGINVSDARNITLSPDQKWAA